MPVQMYECLLMLDTSKVAGDMQASVGQLHHAFERHKAEIVASRPWDERKLAYQIGKQKKAMYYLVYAKAETRSVKDIESDLKLNEAVMRFLVTRIEPKLEEAMLAVAKDPRALALQAANEELVDEFEMPGGRG